MYIESIFIQNFRKIKNLQLNLNKDLNFIIGENDSGKTALIDALKFVLGTVSNDFLYIQPEDFNDIGQKIIISIILTEFSDDQAKKFIDWGCEIDGIFKLKITFDAEFFKQKIFTHIKGGTIYEEDEGKALDPEVRSLLNTIYLKPLRDADRELSAGKNSRLSQILLGHKYFATKSKEEEENHDLIKKLNDFNIEVQEYFENPHDSLPDIITEVIRKNYKQFTGDESSVISISAGEARLKPLLEKLSLLIFPKPTIILYEFRMSKEGANKLLLFLYTQ